MAYCTQSDLLNQMTTEERVQLTDTRCFVRQGFSPAVQVAAGAATTEGVRGKPVLGFPGITG